MANSVLNVVRDKFRQGEHVLSICESYQIIGSEHKNRLLALVGHNLAFALFSFSTSKWPPESFSDLTVDAIFPLNGDFKLDNNCSTAGSISTHQFRIISSAGQSLFYYPLVASDLFKSFPAFEQDVRERTNTLPNGFNGNVNNFLKDQQFQWLDTYKRDDFTAIDRSIANGSILLKRRESKFHEELEKREHEYIIFKDFRVYTATWNVNGQPSGQVNLKPWLTTTEEPPDIYAVAFQELDLSPKAIVNSESRPDPIWIRKIMDGLHPGAVYEELVSVRLVGMMMSVFVKADIRKYIVRCSTQTVATGALNFLGNKGGVGVSLKLNEGFICFVNSHLAAHVYEVDRRKEDHDGIVQRMQFQHGIERKSIDEHNHIFWIGDLNYRLTDCPPRQDLPYLSDGLAINNNMTQLLVYDQLKQEMGRKRVFMGYTEGPITFRPTYKYDPGTDNWDSSEKHRSPAWCDRVLWKGERIRLLNYGSIMALQLSDHKPVYGVFATGIKTRDEIRYKKVHEEVLKSVDKYENDNQPQITVEKTDIDFDVIRFNETYTRDFTIANNCHLPVHFEFRGKEGRSSKICEDFIHVEPTQGELITGVLCVFCALDCTALVSKIPKNDLKLFVSGDSLSIRIKVFIDVQMAWRMHRKQKESGQQIPFDILVLHVKNGRDIFITIIGEYQPSCFGFSVETLTRIKDPIFDTNLRQLLEIENQTETKYQDQTEKRVKIPREVFWLTKYLKENALETPHLFTVDRVYAKNPNINDVRDWLDRRLFSDECPGTPHTVAESLLMLLESSPEPLVSPLEEECLYADTLEKSFEIVRILSVPKKNVFLYICVFLRHLLQFNNLNRLEAGKLAIIFGKVMIRGHESRTTNLYRAMSDSERDARRAAFVLRFLTQDIHQLATVELELAEPV